MPTGLKRYQQSKQSHFVTFTCYRRLRHLDPAAMKNLVVAALEQTRRRFSLCVYGFVVMPEHMHFLVSEPERALLSHAIQSFKIAAARRSAKHRECDGATSPLWQKRYYDRNIRSYSDFLEKLKYIHRNPVKRGLVERPEDWKWSSFRHYATGEDCGVEIESRSTARKRERSGECPTFARRRALMGYAASGVGKCGPPAQKARAHVAAVRRRLVSLEA